MEENQENQERIQKIAGEKNIDKETAVFDEHEGEIIDIESLLEEPSPVSYKLKNLMRYGVTVEQIKQVYTNTASLSPGANIDLAFSELDKVFFILANQINSAPTYIMVDMMTGLIDDVRTQQRAIELGYESVPPLSTTKNETEFLLIDAINYLKDSSVLGRADEMYNTFGDMQDMYEHLLKHMNKSKYIRDDFNNIILNMKNYEEYGVTIEDLFHLIDVKAETSIDSFEDCDVLKGIYAFKRLVNENANERTKASELDRIKEAFEKCTPEEREKYEVFLNEDGLIDEKKLIDFADDYAHKRDEGSIANKLISYMNDRKEFSELDNNDKEEILILLARSFEHTDDCEPMKAVAKKISEKLGIEYNIESVCKELNGIVDRDFTPDELKKYIKKFRFNEYTAEVKLEKVDANLSKEKHREEDGRKQRWTYQKEKEYSIRENCIVAGLQKMMQINEKTGNDFRGFEVLKLYEHYYLKGGSNMPETAAIKKFIENNPKFFDDYAAKYVSRRILNNDGTLSITRVKEMLDGVKLERESEERVGEYIRLFDDMSSSIDVEKQKQLHTDLQNIDLNNQKPSPETKQEILDILKELDIRMLEPDEFNKLLNMDDIGGVVAQMKEEALKDYDPKKKLRLDAKTKEDALNETMLLLEARVEAFRGTAFFGKASAERDQFYEANQGMKALSVRGEDGLLTPEGKKKVDDYFKQYKERKIKNHINDVVNQDIEKDSDRKTNFAKWLLLGLEADDMGLRENSLKRLIQLYPELKKQQDIDPNEFRSKVYAQVYGKEFTEEEIAGKIQAMDANLEKMIFRESTFITKEEKESALASEDSTKRIVKLAKITDENFEEFFDKHQEFLDASQTDLEVSDMQNNFVGSKIRFSTKDDEMVTALYAESTMKSWLSSKEEAEILVLTFQQMLDEEREDAKSKPGSMLKFRYVKNMHETFNSQYDLSAYLDENGKMDPADFSTGKDVIDSKITSELLKGFTRDILGSKNQYDNLTAHGRRMYCESILSALEHANNTSDPSTKEVMEKFAYRALERMNTDDRTVLEFDQDGDAVINKENLLEVLGKEGYCVESGNLSDVQKNAYFAYKNGLVYKKIEEYAKKDESAFYRPSSTDSVKKLKEIEQLKVSEKKKQLDKVRHSGKKSKRFHGKRDIKVNKQRPILKKAHADYSVNSINIRNMDQGSLSRLINNADKSWYKDKMIDEHIKKMTERVDDTHNINAIKIEEIGLDDKYFKNKDTYTAIIKEKTLRDDSAVQRKDVDTKNLADIAEPVNDGFDNDYITETGEKNGLFDNIKKFFQRFTTKKLSDGKEESKKPGFLAKIFGHKDKVKPEVEEVAVLDTANDSKAKQSNPFAIDNKDGNIESAALASMNANRESDKSNSNLGIDQEVDEVSQ